MTDKVIQVRALTPSDVPLFKALVRVFGEAFEDLPTYQDAVPDDAYLKALLARDNFIVVVALDEGDVVGGLAAYVLDKFERVRKEIYIYDLAVRDSHRRRGIATAIIRTLQTVAHDRGAYVIFVQADQGDTPAIRLYESLGTREDVHHFDIAVKK